jgi:hypothetical protein
MRLGNSLPRYNVRNFSEQQDKVVFATLTSKGQITLPKESQAQWEAITVKQTIGVTMPAMLNRWKKNIKKGAAFQKLM